jgi:hypothetical protein
MLEHLFVNVIVFGSLMIEFSFEMLGSFVVGMGLMCKFDTNFSWVASLDGG